MPIGSAKIGVLGAGLVPGGTITFNTSGNWTIPPGVKRVNITGKGGTGNPGNSGNSGNAGNLGTGGGGGAGSNRACTPACFSYAAAGGVAYTGVNGDFSTGTTAGGTTRVNSPFAGNSGSAGASGSAGQAGQAGQAGNPGQTSSGLGNNFPGGAGGNAGAAGNAGNGGSGGNGGGGAQTTTGGSGGNGGGSGTAGAGMLARPPVQSNTGGAGGGGAGATNDGFQGVVLPSYQQVNPSEGVAALGGKGGNTSNYSVPIPTNPFGQLERRDYRTTPCPSRNSTNLPSNATGGPGGGGYNLVGILGAAAIGGGPCFGAQLRVPGANVFSPYPLANPASQALRSGGGGGAGGIGPLPVIDNPTGQNFHGSGGGGGGRGNVGNAGGSGGAGGTGAAGTPQTFNCVNVTPGATVPITVGSPGGQIVISWNPQ